MQRVLQRSVGGEVYTRAVPLGGKDRKPPPWWVVWVAMRVAPPLRRRAKRIDWALRERLPERLIERWPGRGSSSAATLPPYGRSTCAPWRTSSCWSIWAACWSSCAAARSLTSCWCRRTGSRCTSLGRPAKSCWAGRRPSRWPCWSAAPRRPPSPAGPCATWPLRWPPRRGSSGPSRGGRRASRSLADGGSAACDPGPGVPGGIWPPHVQL
jgi:hypothetical protein